MSALRVLADDGSVHIFPPGTSSDAMGNILAEYHKEWQKHFPSNKYAPSPGLLGTPSDDGHPKLFEHSS